MSKTFDIKSLAIWGGAAFVGYFIWRSKMSGRGFAEEVGVALTDMAGGIVSGGAGAIGSTVGLPEPSQLTSSPSVSRWIIDNPAGGYLSASAWSTAAAFAQAMTMPAGSGTPPPAGSPAALHFPPYSQAVQGYPSEPQDPTNIYDGAYYDAMGNPVLFSDMESIPEPIKAYGGPVFAPIRADGHMDPGDQPIYTQPPDHLYAPNDPRLPQF